MAYLRNTLQHMKLTTTRLCNTRDAYAESTHESAFILLQSNYFFNTDVRKFIIVIIL